MSVGRRVTGVVVAFDDGIGRGLLRGEDGIEYGFHCLDIADGSRTIGIDTPVRARLAPRLGRWEVTEVAAITSR
jgi:CspA family cold shock protein